MTTTINTAIIIVIMFTWLIATEFLIFIVTKQIVRKAIFEHQEIYDYYKESRWKYALGGIVGEYFALVIVYGICNNLLSIITIIIENKMVFVDVSTLACLIALVLGIFAVVVLIISMSRDKKRIRTYNPDTKISWVMTVIYLIAMFVATRPVSLFWEVLG